MLGTKKFIAFPDLLKYERNAVAISLYMICVVTCRETDTTNLSALWLIRIEAGLSLWRPGFKFGAVYVGFLVEKVALGQIFLRALWFHYQ